MSLVDIEYHKPCSYYDDGYHRKRSGWYTCECGASSAWHEVVPVEPDYEAASLEASNLMIHIDELGLKAIVDAALGIGGDGE